MRIDAETTMPPFGSVLVGSELAVWVPVFPISSAVESGVVCLSIEGTFVQKRFPRTAVKLKSMFDLTIMVHFISG